MALVHCEERRGLATLYMFNTEKTIQEYKQTPLLLGPSQGLFDTVNKCYPKIWSLYKEMKSLDWSEDEFDYSQCNIDFKNCPKDISDMMIRTLAWQWEADSIASRAIISCLGPYITSSELWAAWSRVSDNEVIHAATYSEIVRMSFDNPEEVLSEVLAVKESLERLDNVASTFGTAFTLGNKYNIGLQENDQTLYNAGYNAIQALLMLERIQFMASFAITFTICSTGLFQSIGKAVQKICQDELEVHCELDKEVLRQEWKTPRGIAAKNELKETTSKLFHEIVESEMKWVDYLFSEGRNLVGTNPDIIKQWVLFNAKDVAKFLEIESEYVFPKKNPMPNLENWINMNKQQSAPQEQDIAAYKIGSTKKDDEGVIFDIDF